MFRILITGQDGTFYVSSYKGDRISTWGIGDGQGKANAVIVSWETCTLLVDTFNEDCDQSGQHLIAHWEVV